MNQEEIRSEKCVQAHPEMVVNVIQAVFLWWERNFSILNLL